MQSSTDLVCKIPNTTKPWPQSACNSREFIVNFQMIPYEMLPFNLLRRSAHSPLSPLCVPVPVRWTCSADDFYWQWNSWTMVLWFSTSSWLLTVGDESFGNSIKFKSNLEVGRGEKDVTGINYLILVPSRTLSCGLAVARISFVLRFFLLHVIPLQFFRFRRN